MEREVERERLLNELQESFQNVVEGFNAVQEQQAQVIRGLDEARACQRSNFGYLKFPLLNKVSISTTTHSAAIEAPYSHFFSYFPSFTPRRKTKHEMIMIAD